MFSSVSVVTRRTHTVEPRGSLLTSGTHSSNIALPRVVAVGVTRADNVVGLVDSLSSERHLARAPAHERAVLAAFTSAWVVRVDYRVSGAIAAPADASRSVPQERSFHGSLVLVASLPDDAGGCTLRFLGSLHSFAPHIELRGVMYDRICASVGPDRRSVVGARRRRPYLLDVDLKRVYVLATTSRRELDLVIVELRVPLEYARRERQGDHADGAVDGVPIASPLPDWLWPDDAPSNSGGGGGGGHDGDDGSSFTGAVIGFPAAPDETELAQAFYCSACRAAAFEAIERGIDAPYDAGGCVDAALCVREHFVHFRDRMESAFASYGESVVSLGLVHEMSDVAGESVLRVQSLVEIEQKAAAAAAATAVAAASAGGADESELKRAAPPLTAAQEERSSATRDVDVYEANAIGGLSGGAVLAFGGTSARIVGIARGFCGPDLSARNCFEPISIAILQQACKQSVRDVAR
jgi:hypothetical protein